MNNVQPHCKYIENAVRNRHLQAALDTEPGDPNAHSQVVAEIQQLGNVYMQTGALATFIVQRDGCGPFGVLVAFSEHGGNIQEFRTHVEHTPDDEFEDEDDEGDA